MTLHRIVARLCTFCACVGLLVSYGAFQLDRVVSTPEPFAARSTTLLNDPEVKEELVSQIAERLEAQYSPLLLAAAAYGYESLDDPHMTFELIAERTVDSERFAEVWRNAIRELHYAAFERADYTPILDATVVTAEARSAAAEIEPLVLPFLDEGDELVVEVSHREVPDLTWLPRRVAFGRIAGTALAVIGATLALTLAVTPWRPSRTIGIVSIVLGAATHLTIQFSPSFFLFFTENKVGDNQDVAALVFKTALESFGPLANLFLVFGGFLLVASLIWQHSVTQRGAQSTERQPLVPRLLDDSPFTPA